MPVALQKIRYADLNSRQSDAPNPRLLAAIEQSRL